MSTTIQSANENLWRWRHAICQRAGTGGLTYPVLGQGGTVALVSSPGSTFEAKDGGFVVFGLTPFTAQRWRTFAAWYHELTGSDEFLDPKWLEPSTRLDFREETNRAIATLCSLLPRDELSEKGQQLGLMVVPVNSVGDIAKDRHLIERGCFPMVEMPGVGRELPMVRSPFRSSAYEPAPATGPALGQDSRWALRTLAGFGEAEIDHLVAGGVVRAESSAQPDAKPSRPASRSLRSAGVPSAPLKGVRVLDFCWQAAGPLITEMLANLGADVIKVESLARIDTVREFHHPPHNATIDTGAFFQDCNTGKRSITLNLGTPRGIEIVKDLVRTADVVTANFTPDRMDRWSLGYPDLRAVREDIIMASFPVMGSEGPNSHWRGIGNSVVAMSGLAWHTGAPGRPPVGLGTLHTDFTLAPLGTAAIVAALIERDRTGKGQFIEMAQYEAALQLFDSELTDCLVNGTVAPRRGNRSAQSCPHGIFPSAGDDRWVAIEARSTVEWHALCQVIGRADLAMQPALNTVDGRRESEDEIESAISSWTRTIDPWEAAGALQAARIPASPLEHVGDLVDGDPGMREFFYPFVHPAGVDYLAQHQPFLWDGGRLPISRAPLLGEHNEEVFRGELRMDEEQFVQLMVDRVIY